MRRCLQSFRLLGGLFVSSLVLCLCLGQAAFSFNTDGVSSPVQASFVQPTQTANLTQQGLNQYQRGELQAAIALWQTALSLTPEQPSETRTNLLRYLARANQQIGQADHAIAYLNQLIADYRQTGNMQQAGRMLTEQAQAYSNLGQHRQAIVLLCGDPAMERTCTRNSALAIARDQTDTVGEMAALGSLGNAYRLRSEYEESIQALQKTLSLAMQTNNQPYVFSALNSLGNVYVSLAKRDDRRRQYAEQSAADQEAQTFAQNVARYDGKAIESFEASLVAARAQRDPLGELRSLLNLIVPLQRQQVAISGQRSAVSGQTAEQNVEHVQALSRQASSTSSDRLQQAQDLLARLPNSREKAYATLRLATFMQLVSGQPATIDVDPTTRCLAAEVPLPVETLLRQAIAIAQQIQDSQSEAFALGRLGHVYECRQAYGQALALTQQAQLTAANQDSRYLWEWQAGRILQAQGKTTDAIAAYDTAVKTLQGIRGDLAIASRDFQFDFRDTVEPVYRELTALYLQQATDSQKQVAQQLESKALSKNVSLSATASMIEAALETIDRLRLAELQNYFGDDCSLEATAKPITLVDQKTAVLSSIILGDRVAVILTLPTQTQQFRSQVQWLPADAQTLRATINDLRLRLEKRSDLANTYEAPAQQVYDWLIRPFAQALQTAQIETLVFIQDGILRSIPMATLSDGKQFLVEQYAIASTLSLTLVDPTQLDPQSLRVLSFGLTKPATVEGPTFFAPLSFVKAEIDSIQATIPDSKGLLDDAFTPERLQQELMQNAFPIVHLATHGRFGIDSRDTFLVTGKREKQRLEDGTAGVEAEQGSGAALPQNAAIAAQTYNKKLTMNALYRMIRNIRHGNALELLTLTACETAVGSDRDALGIAGISLQAGARSTVASLWQVDDQATAQLITHFYQALRQGMSRAKALQAAQKTWLQQHPDERHHPGYWAALILVGNWL